MRLTTKGRFAVTAMLDLAIHETQDVTDNKPVTLAAISERQDISLSYLEQLFSKLRRQGLVKSIRGPGGGYNLAKAYTDISVAEIINAVDEQIDATQCGGNENCREEGRCMTHDLWSALNTKILEYLAGVTIEDLVSSQKDGQKVLITPRTYSATNESMSATKTEVAA